MTSCSLLFHISVKTREAGPREGDAGWCGVARWYVLLLFEAVIGRICFSERFGRRSIDIDCLLINDRSHMTRLARSIFAFLLLVAMTAVPALAQDSGMSGEHAGAKEAAQEAATEWLELTDTGEFAQSYEQSAALMTEKVNQKQWEQKIGQREKQLGALQSREFAEAQYRDSLQQLPDGEYVLLRYESQFEKAKFNEVLLAMKEDGEWKVASYTLRPMRPSAPPSGGRPGGNGGRQ